MTELPRGWTRASLGDCLSPRGLFDGPFGSSLKTSDYTSAGVRVIRLENVANLHFVAEKQTFVSEAKYQSLQKHAVGEGDIVFGSFVDGATRVCLLPDLGGPAIAKADCYCIRPAPSVLDARFLVYQLGSPRTRDALIEEIHGATRPRVTTGQLRQLEVLVPPLAEQRRIVRQADSLLANVQAVRDRLERARLVVDRFRESVLDAACGGRLTKVWRQDSRSAERVESLAALSERRRRLFEERESRRRARSSVSRPRRYPDLLPVSPPEGTVLPKGWQWTNVSHLALLDVGHAFRSAGFSDRGVRLLRGENVAPGRLRWEDSRYWPEQRLAEFGELLVDKGDLILALDRPLISAGLKLARVAEEDLPALLVQRVMRFKTFDQGITDYLEICLRHHRFTRSLIEGGLTGSDLPHITGNGVAAFPIALPPPAEREEVVTRARALLAFADQIQQRLIAASALVTTLPNRVITKALAGELVPAESELARIEGRTYESGEESLARVQAEWAVKDAAAAKRRKRRSARGRRAAA